MSGIKDHLRTITPQNLEAESAVLGAIMLDNDSIHRVLEIIGSDDIHRESHRKIFLAMKDLAEQSEPIDVITLSASLKERGQLEERGGSSYIASLNDFVPTSVNVHHYAEIVRKKANERRLVFDLTLAWEDLVQARVDLNEIVSRLTTSLLKVGDRGLNSFEPISDVVVQTLKRIEQAHERGSLVTGIPPALHFLIRVWAAFTPGKEIIIAGRTGMGKTALVGAWCRRKGLWSRICNSREPIPRNRPVAYGGDPPVSKIEICVAESLSA
jgi:replicative DNA helicase